MQLSQDTRLRLILVWFCEAVVSMHAQYRVHWCTNLILPLTHAPPAHGVFNRSMTTSRQDNLWIFLVYCRSTFVKRRPSTSQFIERWRLLLVWWLVTLQLTRSVIDFYCVIIRGPEPVVECDMTKWNLIRGNKRQKLVQKEHNNKNW